MKNDFISYILCSLLSLNIPQGRIANVVQQFCLTVSLYYLHIHVSLSYSVDFLSVSFRSWATIQGDSPGIALTNLSRRPRSRSPCSQRKSSSSSRRNTLAGLWRRRNKSHPNKRHCSLRGNTRVAVSRAEEWISGPDYIHFAQQNAVMFQRLSSKVDS